MLMKLAVLVVLGVVLANSCSAMPRKAWTDGVIRSAEAPAYQEVGDLGSSDANTNNHHHIPRDQYNNYVNGAPYVPGTDADVGIYRDQSCSNSRAVGGYSAVVDKDHCLGPRPGGGDRGSWSGSAKGTAETGLLLRDSELGMLVLAVLGLDLMEAVSSAAEGMEITPDIASALGFAPRPWHQARGRKIVVGAFRWYSSFFFLSDPETITAMEDFCKEIYAVNGVSHVKFPDHYPVSRLFGCVEVAGCVRYEELVTWEQVPESVRLEG
ncbi:hypothetical protein ZIOFF_023010 [Zingiber officinale]|uniref:Uncharacterized protein n=1 Tax=Zingiber officinale TaxID=94328 RepID=A0A8J5HMD1_ZINOF|nr:hypothetical protein ZIOFF_023010 [Zingiber officinale]